MKRFELRKQACHERALAYGPRQKEACHDGHSGAECLSPQADHDSNSIRSARLEKIRKRQIMTGRVSGQGYLPDMSQASNGRQKPAEESETGKA
jgi:hypothetical protein